jgi:hypothetical protein
MVTPFGKDDLLRLLAELGRRASAIGAVELTLVGGSAGILTGQLPSARVTIDCDVIRAAPPEHLAALQALAAQMGRELDLPANWFSDEVARLDVLPDGWHKRRVDVSTFGSLRVWCVGRIDLLATKAYAGRMQDRADVLDMKPTPEELTFIKCYLQQLRVPNRQANLDQVQSALRFVEALENASP